MKQDFRPLSRGVLSTGSGVTKPGDDDVQPYTVGVAGKATTGTPVPGRIPITTRYTSLELKKDALFGKVEDGIRKHMQRLEIIWQVLGQSPTSASANSEHLNALTSNFVLDRLTEQLLTHEIPGAMNPELEKATNNLNAMFKDIYRV